MECFCSTSEKQDGDGLKERSKRSENEIFEQSTCVWLSPSHRFSPWHQLPSLMKVALLPLSCCRKLSMYSVMTFRGHRWSCCQSARRLVLSRGRLGCGQDEMNRCERREGPAWLCNLGHTLCICSFKSKYTECADRYVCVSKFQGKPYTLLSLTNSVESVESWCHWIRICTVCVCGLGCNPAYLYVLQCERWECGNELSVSSVGLRSLQHSCVSINRAYSEVWEVDVLCYYKLRSSGRAGRAGFTLTLKTHRKEKSLRLHNFALDWNFCNKKM